MTMYFFQQKAATLKAPENQTNYKQLQITKIINSNESQNKNTSGFLSTINRKKIRQINKRKIHLRTSTRTWQS